MQASTEGPGRVLYSGCELGPWWSRVDAIGLGGRCFWTALYAEFSDVVAAVGGALVRSQTGRFQRSRSRFGSWLGCHSASRGWAE
jgi:hypothetical protein